MKFSGFSTKLADEVANLTATLGSDNTHTTNGRLDSDICIKELLERVKHLDTPAADKQPE